MKKEKKKVEIKHFKRFVIMMILILIFGIITIISVEATSCPQKWINENPDGMCDPDFFEDDKILVCYDPEEDKVHNSLIVEGVNESIAPVDVEKTTKLFGSNCELIFFTSTFVFFAVSVILSILLIKKNKKIPYSSVEHRMFIDKDGVKKIKTTIERYH